MDTAPEPTGLVEVRTSRVSAGPIRSLASLQKEQRHTQGEGGHAEMGAGPGEPCLQATGPRGLPEPPDAGRGGRGLPRERGPVACMVWTSGPGTVGGGTPGFSLGFRRFVSAALELSRRRLPEVRRPCLLSGGQSTGFPGQDSQQRGPLRLVAHCGAEDTCRAAGWHPTSFPGLAGEPKVCGGPRCDLGPGAHRSATPAGGLACGEAARWH